MRNIRTLIPLLFLTLGFTNCAAPDLSDVTLEEFQQIEAQQSALTGPHKWLTQPAGDSVTCGTDGFGGWRGQLFPFMSSRMISVGTRDSATVCGGPGFHSGYPGSHTTGYSTYLQGYLNQVPTELLILMLGTNGDSDGQNYVDILLAPTFANHPDIKVLVLAIPDAPSQGTYPATYNASLSAAVNAYSNGLGGDRLRYTGCTEFLSPNEFDPDMLHPNTAGYNRIANCIFKRLNQWVY